MHSVPDMPPEAWWLTALVLIVLASSAAVDAFTSTVPDPLVFLGLLAVTGTQGVYVSWPFAAAHLAWAIAAAACLWAINMAWYYAFKQDAIGMGDAKWTMLAVACFGLTPAFYAWGIGAVLAILYLGAAKLVRYQLMHVYFAPFLFIGLIAGLYWLHAMPA
ncbi:MAG TPA: prepilin peptidase [Alphaproteobacteria bacterium]|nr:prepilin peptidase [Alphaproteobacteria bacterium]